MLFAQEIHDDIIILISFDEFSSEEFCSINESQLIWTWRIIFTGSFINYYSMTYGEV